MSWTKWTISIIFAMLPSIYGIPQVWGAENGVTPSGKASLSLSRGKAILKQLKDSKEYIMAASFRVKYVRGGRVRVLIIPRNYWRNVVTAVKSYREALDELMKLPLKSFLKHPRAFVEASDALKWGNTNSVAIDLYSGSRFGKVMMVLP